MILAYFRRDNLLEKQKRLLKKNRRVRFDLVRNTLHSYTPVKCKFMVTWAKNKSCVVYHHEPDPAGYDTLHCRKTLYVRDRPEVEDLDDDGDVGIGGS
ncbi:MAG: hypothetical protein LQ338_005499 [Usnochroma carphineum]|nr:MAG: hypothetical protein LQ338_005499 [Usnochroma carphineum]